MTEKDVRDALNKAQEAFGICSDEPDFKVDCPGCGNVIKM